MKRIQSTMTGAGYFAIGDIHGCLDKLLSG